MFYTDKIQKSIEFAILVHEIDQKQKRKSKDVAYITHPLSVGIILAGVGASEDVICAGILHDVIEDSIEEKKVTKNDVSVLFGEVVAGLVESVTENMEIVSWEEKKSDNLEKIKKLSHDSLLIKSADVLSNTTEFLSDYQKNGEKIFDYFGGSKEKFLQNILNVLDAILDRWKDNPLRDDLLKTMNKVRKSID